MLIYRGEPAPRNRLGYDPLKDSDDIVGAFKNHWMYGEGSEESTLPDANIHEQEDGSIIAVCATGNIRFYTFLAPRAQKVYLYINTLSNCK